MNKIKKYSLIFLISIIIIILFKYNFILQTSVFYGVNIWINKVFPTLFLMFIINDLIINLDLLKEINKFINPIFNKFFKTTGSSSNVFLLTLFSGTPSSAFIIKEMLNNNKITIDDANKLIAFTFFPNPLFLYTMLSLSFNKMIVWKIILIIYLSNLIIGFIFRNKYNSISINYDNKANSNKSIFLIIPSSIKKSFDTLLMILGTIVFYMIITNLISHILNLNNISEIIIKGIFEMTQCLNEIPNLKILSIIKEIITISIISFGGLSIHTQVLSIISDTQINYKNFFIGRIFHVLISTCSYLCMFFITSG